MSFNETKHHGTPELPIELYIINSDHPKYEMVLHWHSAIEIIRVTNGQLDVSLNAQAYKAKAGDILISNSETIHGAIPHEGCEYECIVFHPDEIITGENRCAGFIKELLNRSTHLCEYISHNSSPGIERIVNELSIRLQCKDESSDFAVISLIYGFFSAVISEKLYERKKQNPHERDFAKLKRAIEFMRENYSKDIRLSDIAAVSDISAKYFCRFFKKMTDKTPIEYLVDYRIERASKMLISGKMPVTEIALSCGFNDLSYFIKTFKRYKGISPLKFRADHEK
ncbi:MAG: helix-turn-helix transcriptional regulator [Clostridia bacterium]|nr:helix-turn-helix transcriptional regulator [Clostridia bacterium]